MSEIDYCRAKQFAKFSKFWMCARQRKNAETATSFLEEYYVRTAFFDSTTSTIQITLPLVTYSGILHQRINHG